MKTITLPALIEKANWNEFHSDALVTIRDAEKRENKEEADWKMLDFDDSAKGYANDIVSNYDALSNIIFKSNITEPFKELEAANYYDLISEWADGQVDIYNYSLWLTAVDFQDYIEDAIQDFGIGDKPDLIKMFMAGQYKCYQELAQDIFNFLEEQATIILQ